MMTAKQTRSLITADEKQLKEIRDFATAMPTILKLSRASGLNNVGYALKQKTKEAVTGNSLGWALLSPHTPIVNANRPARGKKPLGFQLSAEGLAKFWGAIGNLPVYFLDYENSELFFGFYEGTFGTKANSKGNSAGTAKKRVPNVIGAAAMKIARKVTEGSVISDAELDRVVGISEKGHGGATMRRYLASVGVFIPRGKGGLVIKARPLIGPVVEANQEKIPELFTKKFWDKVAKLCDDPVWLAMTADALSSGNLDSAATDIESIFKAN